MAATGDFKFSYEPLNNQDFPIRVLQVQPGDNSEPLSCKLINYCDASEKGWTCLSYTWGTELPKEEILINGVPFPVRSNVYSFLRQAQRQGPRNLWIDSICINQSDIPERNSQVGLMSEIFGEAELVTVWLGQTSPALERAFRMLDSGFDADTVTIRAAAGQPVFAKFSPDECSSLFEACGAAIWTRRWVKQEIMLPESVILSCGEASVSISVFFAVMDALIDYETFHDHTMHASESSIEGCVEQSETCFFHATNYNQRLRQCANVLAFYSATRSKQRQISLPVLLSMFQDSDCTDFRDHVYAFRGVMEQGMALRVDYDMRNIGMFLMTLDFIAQTTHPRLRGVNAAERDLLVDLHRGFKLTDKDMEDIFEICQTSLLVQIGTSFEMLRKDISVSKFMSSITDRDELMALPWRNKDLCKDCCKVLGDPELDEHHTVLNQLRADPARDVWIYGLRTRCGPSLEGLRAVYEPRWLYECSEDTLQLIDSGTFKKHHCLALLFDAYGKEQELKEWLDEVKDHFVVMVTDTDDAAYQMHVFIRPGCDSKECLLAKDPGPA
ncbi:uncharacterized protein FIESC28_11416 [Fusarium coffeatum]|uniref:Heterokaryon incompatibility domain-containing protein n=1 Tax=Fusarium coffeatum TaxID=231269 RepID=A0A366QK07_9HYPO|nr:uncharacterized protein FIESC28_11416 [Fusarium coffeatum]RBR05167.1 hypothetical protein FIESC28_11416 [Fusarium coffeatum]